MLQGGNGCKGKKLYVRARARENYMNIHASLIDMELLQLLNGHNDLDLIFDEEE